MANGQWLIAEFSILNSQLRSRGDKILSLRFFSAKMADCDAKIINGTRFEQEYFRKQEITK